MATVKQETEQLIIADVVFSKSVLKKTETTRANAYPVLSEYAAQPPEIQRFMTAEHGDLFSRYYRSNGAARNSGSKILKQMSKTSTFKKDETGQLYISEMRPLLPKDYTIAIVGKGKAKSTFPIPIEQEPEPLIPLHQSQDTLFFIATNKTVKNKSVSADDILGIKSKTGKRKKKIDYSSNDVIINKKEKENLVDEMLLDNVIADANTKVTTVRVKPKLGFLDEIIEKKEDN